jgi:hypothetical protein
MKDTAWKGRATPFLGFPIACRPAKDYNRDWKELLDPPWKIAFPSWVIAHFYVNLKDSTNLC